jgi:nucleoside-diphosphate-sugar epimerase
MKVLVTGANGFVGAALVQRILADELAAEIVATVRSSVCALPTGVERIVVGGIDEANDWREALTGTEVVIHLAARVHVMADTATNPLAEFRRVNVQGTLNLARQAAASGVRRFIFVSSIKVNGEATLPGCPFTADDAPAPLDAYGVSKMEAEQGLRELA